MPIPIPISAAVLGLIPDIVEGLINHPTNFPADSLDVPTLMKAVIGLFLRKAKLPIIAGSSGTPANVDDLVATVIHLVTGIQFKNGQPPTGRLTEELANLLTQRCHPPVANGPVAPPGPAPVGGGGVNDGKIPILFTVDSTIPPINGISADLLIGQSILLWAHNLPGRFNIQNVTDSPQHANINVLWEPLDPAGVILGSTQLGGPGNMKGPLKLQLNSSINNWTPFLFIGAACHEFGHAMGLEHLDDTTALMNAVIDTNVDQPDDVDAQALKARWGF